MNMDYSQWLIIKTDLVYSWADKTRQENQRRYRK